MLDTMRNFSDLLKTLQTRNTLSVFSVYNPLSIDGGLSVFFDDYANDTREVLDITFKYDQYTYSQLWGYQSDKHCWPNHRVSGKRVEWNNRRGLKHLREFLSSLSSTLTYYPNGKFSVYPTQKKFYSDIHGQFDYFHWVANHATPSASH